MVKASTVDFEYPLIGFPKSEGDLLFDKLFPLTHCAASYIKDETLIDMELVDNRRRRWTVRSVQLEKPLPEKRWWHLFTPNPTVGFDLELEEIAPISLDELKRRILDAWELEDPDHEPAIQRAPDFATIYRETNQQGCGLL